MASIPSVVFVLLSRYLQYEPYDICVNASNSGIEMIILFKNRRIGAQSFAHTVVSESENANRCRDFSLIPKTKIRTAK